MKRIWFKPDCIEWIRTGKKTTTWRSRKHNGEYVVVKGSRFNAIPIKPRLVLSITPICEIEFSKVCKNWKTEGEFKSEIQFDKWLKKNKITGKCGYLHQIVVIKPKQYIQKELEKELKKVDLK